MMDDEPATLQHRHGDLACPACGYLRRGLEVADNCPECGVRGFVGEVIVGGLRVTAAPVGRLRRNARIVFIVVPLLVLLALLSYPSLRGSRGSGGAWLLYTVLGEAILLALLTFAPRIRRMFVDRSTEDTSPERVVWEIRPMGVGVRDGHESRHIRQDRIRRVWSDVAASPKYARVRIELKNTPGARPFETPEIMLRGDPALQRATVEAIRALLEKPGNLG